MKSALALVIMLLLLGRLLGPNGKVYSVEIIPQLTDFAKRNLNKAGIKNVSVILGDGSRGYDEEAPYDRVIATAASPEKNLKIWMNQLKVGGILVAPVGGYPQVMTRIRRKMKGFEREELGDFVFVPLRVDGQK